ncbi:MAG: ligand-binding sensor domain-containing protein [Francisellaceae bacterium]
MSLLSGILLGSIALTGCGGSSNSDTSDNVDIDSPSSVVSIGGTTSTFTITNTDQANLAFSATNAADGVAKNIKLYFTNPDDATKFTISYTGCDELNAGGQCQVIVTQKANNYNKGQQIGAYIQGENTAKYPITITVDKLDIVNTNTTGVISPGDTVNYSVVNPTQQDISGVTYTASEGATLSGDCTDTLLANSSCSLNVSIADDATTGDLGLSIAGETYSSDTNGQPLTIVRPALTLSTNNLDQTATEITPGQSVRMTVYNNTAANAKGLAINSTLLNAIMPDKLSVISNTCTNKLNAFESCNFTMEAVAGAEDEAKSWSIPAGDNFNQVDGKMVVVGEPQNLNLSSSAANIITSSKSDASFDLTLANTTGYDVTNLAFVNPDNTKFSIDAADSSCDDLTNATLAKNAECHYRITYNPGEVLDYYTKPYTLKVEGAANLENISAESTVDTINNKLFYSIPFDTMLSGNKLPTKRARFVIDVDVNSQEKLIVGTSAGLAISTDSGKIWRYITTAKGLAGNRISTAYWFDSNTNDLYVGTYSGLSIVDLTTDTVIKNYTMADGLPSNSINAFVMDGNNLFVGTSAGLSVLDISAGADKGVVTKTYTQAADSLGDDRIYSLVKDGDNLFVGTNGGVSVLDISAGADKGKVSKTYTQADDKLGSNDIRSLVKDGDNLFVGAYGGGVSVLDISAGADKGTVSKTYTQAADNLASNNIFSLLKDGDNLFVGTAASGLSVLDISAGADKGTVSRTYTTADGLGNNFIYNLTFNDNKLYVGTRSK